MDIPVLNNHLKRQYILLGNANDLHAASSALQRQGETPRYLCAIENGKVIDADGYISIEQCIEVCRSDVSVIVWCVSNCVDAVIRYLEQNDVPVYTTEELYKLNYADSKNRACHNEEMYIDRYGSVHCCCKTHLNNVIGNLSDSDIVDRVINFVPPATCQCAKGKLASSHAQGVTSKPELASIELSSLCNANCIYCFQNDENKGQKYQFYDELLMLIEQLKLPKLIFSGGELLIQPESIDLIKKIRRSHPQIWLHLKSNGCHDTTKIEVVEKLFDSITITLNGFSNGTTSAIMNASFDTIKRFCEEICNRRKVTVGLKLLVSPANICEITDFIEWGLALQPDRLIIPCARIYACAENAPSEWLGSTFNGLNMAYWKPLFMRVGRKIEKTLHFSSPQATCRIQMDEELQKFLGIKEIIEEFNNERKMARII